MGDCRRTAGCLPWAANAPPHAQHVHHVPRERLLAAFCIACISLHILWSRFCSPWLFQCWGASHCAWCVYIPMLCGVWIVGSRPCSKVFLFLMAVAYSSLHQEHLLIHFLLCDRLCLGKARSVDCRKTLIFRWHCLSRQCQFTGSEHQVSCKYFCSSSACRSCKYDISSSMGGFAFILMASDDSDFANKMFRCKDNNSLWSWCLHRNFLAVFQKLGAWKFRKTMQWPYKDVWSHNSEDKINQSSIAITVTAEWSQCERSVR